MQSAKEFAVRLSKCVSIFNGLAHFHDVNAAALIRARDREIVEACKNAMLARWDECFANKNMGKDCFVSALDSVLRDLG